MATTCFPQFEQFVSHFADDFRSPHRETESRIDSAESQLGLKLPESLRWLLTNFGYGKHCGIASLDYILKVTLSKRPKLPSNTLILGQPASHSIPFANSQNPSGNTASSRQLGLVLLQISRDALAQEQVYQIDNSAGSSVSRPLAIRAEGPSLHSHASFPDYVIHRWSQKNPARQDELDQLLDPQPVKEVAETSQVEQQPSPEPEQTKAGETVTPAESSAAEAQTEVTQASMSHPLRNPQEPSSAVPEQIASPQLVSRLAETMLCYQSTKSETEDQQLPPIPEQEPAFPDIVTGNRDQPELNWPSETDESSTHSPSLQDGLDSHLQTIELCQKLLMQPQVPPSDWPRYRSSSPRHSLSIPTHLCGGQLWLTPLHLPPSGRSPQIPEMRYWVMKWQFPQTSDRYGHAQVEGHFLISWLPPEYNTMSLAGRATSLEELNGWDGLLSPAA